MVGVLHSPGDGGARIGVVVVVGGPQYRVGSHRQFVLLGRHLAKHGVAVLRFDYRGIGDSAGAARDFLGIEDDIRAAVDVLLREYPKIEALYIWGLCDAASAALLYAPKDRRILGLVLCNPWVRSETTLAKTMMLTTERMEILRFMRDYYRKRIATWAFWRGLLTGRLRIGAALSSLARNIRRSMGHGETPSPGADSGHFVDRMLVSMRAFEGRTLVILSGNDLTAAEFENLIAGSPSWSKALRDRHVAMRKIPEANHTFATRRWRDQVAEWTAEWLQAPSQNR